MQDMQLLSLSLDEIRNVKIGVTHGAAYAERMSLAFVVQLLRLRQMRGEDHIVLREMDALEGIGKQTSTKIAQQFRHAPLHPLWHKHFSSGRHFYKNVGLRWGVDRGGNRDLTAMISSAAAQYGANPELWQKKIAYDFVMGIEDRSTERRMTGDWIIFARHGGLNYYLDLAEHEEGQKPDALMEKLRHGSACEFPFLFSENNTPDAREAK